MNKKGEFGMFSVILVTFMAIIVGVVLFQVIAQEVGASTNTVEVANESLNTVVNGTAQYLISYRALSDVVIYNETNEVIISASDYTITNNVIDPISGSLSVSILPDTNETTASAWQVSATAQPVTYIANSGGRAMASLIVVFFALAIAVVALEPTLRAGALDLMGK